MTEPLSTSGIPAYRPIRTRGDALPWWILLLAVALLGLGAYYFLTNLSAPGEPIVGGPPSPGATGPGGTGPAAPPVDVAAAQALIEEGACQGCHGPDLAGQGNFPSLLGVAEGPVSDNLQQLAQDHPDNWASLWIAGNSPEVAELDRRGMPAFAERFSQEEIDLIVAYLKSL